MISDLDVQMKAAHDEIYFSFYSKSDLRSMIIFFIAF